MSDLTREPLDRRSITVGGGPVQLGCPQHPEVGTRAIYQSGVLRLLCEGCGFEAARIKVALEDPVETTTAPLEPAGFQLPQLSRVELERAMRSMQTATPDPGMHPEEAAVHVSALAKIEGALQPEEGC